MTPASTRSRVTRRLFAGLLIVAGLAVMLAQDRIRVVEAHTVASVATRLFDVPTVTQGDHPVVFVTLPQRGPVQGWFGVLVTAECTVAWLLGPILAGSGLLALGRRFRMRAVALATALTVALLAAVNVLRLLVILLATHWWGSGSGFRWSHDVYGSLISIVGVCVGCVVLVRLLVRLSPNVARPAG